MILAQDDIDAVLRQAEAAVSELAASSEALAGRPEAGPSAPPSAALRRSARVERILKLSVPLIVRMAARRMRVSEIMQWGRGTIVEFEKPVSAELDLLVNDRCIGQGEAVKAAENFGLRIKRIGSARQKLSSLSSL